MTINVGSILTVGYANWVDQYPIELSGTVGVGDSPADYQLYLGPSASSAPNAYVGGLHFVTHSDMIANGGVSEVTAYNATTKVATVAWSSSDRRPSVGATWKLFNRYPIQRQFRWFRDGVPIPNVRADVYTVQNADAGKTLTVQEIAGTIPPATVAPLIPTVTTTATSAGVFVNAGTTDAGLVGADDIVYVGSFQVPSTFPNSTGYYIESRIKGVSVIPPAYSANGQRALLMIGNTNGTFAQIQIPADAALRTPAQVPVWQNLPNATVISPAPASGVGMAAVALNIGVTDGIDNNNGTYVFRAQHVAGTSKFLFTVGSEYTNQDCSFTYRADLNFNPASVEGPVVIADPVTTIAASPTRYPGGSSRHFSGGICKIPAALQTALGGDMIASNPQTSIVSNNSDGPALMSFSSGDFTSAFAMYETGTARGGSSSTIQLAAGAAGTTSSYYAGFYVKIAGSNAMKVTSYNPSTKTLTVDNTISGFVTAPTAATTYRLYPCLKGQVFAHYGSNEFAVTASGVVNPIYTWANAVIHAVLPSGTRSALCCGAGPQGVFLYGINLRPDNDQLMRIYDPNNPSGTGQHQSVSAEDAGYKIWAYDTDDLVRVKAGTLAANAIRPYGIFKIPNPYGDLDMPSGSGAQAFAYDQETRRLYVVQTWYAGSATAICHVYNITSAASEAI